MEKLRKLQLVEKDCLDFFVKICEENNLEYILDFGTLLGAARHKGFIPWDDDVDLGMPREDYKKFLKIYDKYKNNGRFSLETYKRGAFYKLKDNDYYILNEDRSKSEIDIDIFPLDYYDDVEKVNFLNGYLELSKDRSSAWRKWKTHLKREIHLKILSNGFFKKRFISKTKGPYIGRGVETGFKIKLNPVEKFFPLTEIEFEDRKYKAPKDYDNFLTLLYGDYMTPPENPKPLHHKHIKDIIKIKK
ncbi:LicD family protein [Fusobacterium sp. THCT13E1]